jgi:hypothetical protein
MKMREGECIALAACVTAASFYALAQGTYSLTLFANYGLITYMGSAALISVVNYFRIGRSKMANLSLGFALGLISWMLGLAVYTYAYYVLGTGLPYLSVADAFYLLSYPPMILGAVGMLRPFSKAVVKREWLIVAVTGFVLYVLVTVYVIPPSVNALSGPLEASVTILYPSLDIVLFLLLFPLYFATKAGVFQKAFTFVTLGAALFALGDLAYAYLSVTGLYYDGHPMDLLLFFGCVSVGYGFWRQHADLTSL